MHITRIPDCDGNGTAGWEVGVHIADVSYFLLMNTELDSWAAARGNSIYLVHKVCFLIKKILLLVKDNRRNFFKINLEDYLIC